MGSIFFESTVAEQNRKREVAQKRDFYQGILKYHKQHNALFVKKNANYQSLEDKIASIQRACDAISEGYQGKKKQITLVINEENRGVFDQFFQRNLKGLSAIRDSGALFNIFRLYWTFNRLTVSQLLRLFKEAGYIDGLAQYLHDKFNLDLNINIEETIKKFEGLNEVMRFLSVALFFFRLSVDVFLLIKHTFSKKENDYSTQSERLMYELKKRGFTMMNDVAWTIGNIIGNFNHLFKIADMTAGYVTAGFLVFDIALIATRWVFDKLQFDVELLELKKSLELEGDPEIKKFIEYTIEQHKQNFNAKCFGNAANLAGAVCIFSGFLTAHLLSGVLLASTLGFAACMLGVSLYLSSDLIQTFRKTQLTLDYVQNYRVPAASDLMLEEPVENPFNPEALQAAEAEYKIARNQMMLGLVRNILLPSLFLFACALAWQVCIGLAVATIIVTIVQHQLGESYKKLPGERGGASPAEPDLEEVERLLLPSSSSS